MPTMFEKIWNRHVVAEGPGGQTLLYIDRTVDLASQSLTAPDGSTHRFEVDPFRKQALLKGQDEIALTLEYAREIEAFEAKHAAAMPWLSTKGA